MRLWSLHPKDLDAKGLTAVWREGLLAKAIIEGRTKAYEKHPQMIRFRKAENEEALINQYLSYVLKEANKRNFNFDKSKIKNIKTDEKIKVTKGQALYEFIHLKKKLGYRDINKCKELEKIEFPELNPIFELVEGDIEHWEKVKDLESRNQS